MLFQLKRFHGTVREGFETNDTLRDLNTVLDNIAEPIIQIIVTVEPFLLQHLNDDLNNICI